MGLIAELKNRSSISLDALKHMEVLHRVNRLEQELAETQALLVHFMSRVEKKLGTDIEGDGSLG